MYDIGKCSINIHIITLLLLPSPSFPSNPSKLNTIPKTRLGPAKWFSQLHIVVVLHPCSVRRINVDAIILSRQIPAVCLHLGGTCLSSTAKPTVQYSQQLQKQFSSKLSPTLQILRPLKNAHTHSHSTMASVSLVSRARLALEPFVA